MHEPPNIVRPTWNDLPHAIMNVYCGVMLCADIMYCFRKSLVLELIISSFTFQKMVEYYIQRIEVISASKLRLSFLKYISSVSYGLL